MSSMFHCDVSRWGVWLMSRTTALLISSRGKGERRRRRRKKTKIMCNALKQHMECMSLWSASQLNDIHESGERGTHHVTTLQVGVRRDKLIFGTPMGPIMIISNIGRDFYCFILQWHKAEDTPGGGKNRNSHTHTQGHRVLFFLFRNSFSPILS